MSNCHDLPAAAAAAELKAGEGGREGSLNKNGKRTQK